MTNQTNVNSIAENRQPQRFAAVGKGAEAATIEESDLLDERTVAGVTGNHLALRWRFPESVRSYRWETGAAILLVVGNAQTGRVNGLQGKHGTGQTWDFYTGV